MEYTLYYRNFYKYCNYKCYYCPFSKYEFDKLKLEKDKKYFEKFIRFLEQSNEKYKIFIAPRGEILNFEHYQSGINELTFLENISEVVIQTNLSGNLAWSEYTNKEKLVFWTTYHPDEVRLEDFFSNLQILDKNRIQFSVGVVGIKANFNNIKKLKEKMKLLKNIKSYLWINAYKDVKNYYSDEDIIFLKNIDPLFEINLKDYDSKGKVCRSGKNVFWVEYNGIIHRCWQDKKIKGNIFKNKISDLINEKACEYSKCTCYIGYTNIEELELEKIYKKSLLGRIK